MPRKSRPTLWYRIGRSNWYERVDARGRAIKRQGKENTFGGYNNIIRSLRVRKVAVAARRGGMLDDRIFKVKRPEEKATITLRVKKTGEIIRRDDVRPENFYKFFKEHFNFYYDQAVAGEVIYTIE